MLQDPLQSRLRLALLTSFIINFAFLWGMSHIAIHQLYQNVKPVEVSRITLERKHKPHPRKATAAQKVLPKPIAPHPIKRIPQKPPEGAHHRTLTARPDKSGPLKSGEHSVFAGGNAQLGKPIEQQNPGNAATNPPQPIRTPIPVTPPSPPGPTLDAQPQNEVKPEIPDELKNDNYKSYVRVRVDIESNGSFTPTLLTSSGNAEIDRRVLNALRQWRWKSALRNGIPVRSTQLFKFEFEVR